MNNQPSSDWENLSPVPAPYRAKVLVVEDDTNLLDGVRNILELDNYMVLTAENGMEALGVLRNEAYPPDLIVSDIMMPHMDGITLLERVRQEERWAGIPFIFLTAWGEREDMQRGRKLGVDDYVVKPYDPEDLLITVESRLERHRKLHQLHMGELSQVKRNILTILNHEFRTPLTFVVAYSDLLKKPEAETLSAEDRMFLKGISSGAERLRRLIENFILLVELETAEAQKSFDMRKRVLSDLSDLLRVAQNEINSREDSTCHCVLDIGEGLPAVEVDEDYLRRALVQLLDNAVKFSDGAEEIRLAVSPHEDGLKIEVQDWGRGIPESEVTQIWNSFYQIDRARYEDQGAGSGLAIVWGVVRLHGGKIDIQSKKGEGSTFSIVLPAKPTGI